jgi:hypothetical protein
VIDDLIASLAAIEPAPTKPSEPGGDPNPAVTAFFTHFAEHAGLYRSLLGPRTTAAARLSPVLRATDGLAERHRADARERRAK